MRGVIGVGIDVVSIPRMSRAYQRYGQRLVTRLLTPSEQEQFEQRRQGLSFLASRFAAKEALAKALGTGFRCPFSFQRAAVENRSSGAPQFRIFGALLAYVRRLGGKTIALSLSDSDCCAVGLVIVSGYSASGLSSHQQRI